MRLLLDTHILLWWLQDSPALKAEARRLIADPLNTIFVSAIVMWEIWLKVSIGKLIVPDDFDDVLSKEAFEHLPLASSQTRDVALLPWIHRDPFDRMLVAQARSERLILLTDDTILRGYGDSVLVV